LANLVVSSRSAYDLSLIKAALLAQVGSSRGLSEWVEKAKKKGVEINPFAMIDPKSISFTVERGVDATGSHMRTVYDFNRNPENFVSRLTVMVELSDLKRPVYCAVNLWSQTAEIITAPN
jgi:hypothetical protein